MKQTARHNMALLLSVIYGLIILVQLLPVAMQSAYQGRQCHGNCVECGCAPEKSATRTCCCAKKIIKASSEQHQATPGCDCCKDKAAENSPVLSCGFPCHDSGQQVIWETDEITLLPVSVSEVARSPRDEQYCYRVDRFPTRYVPPPDPPPKLSVII